MAVNFESEKDLEKLKKLKREAREAILEQAERDYEKQPKNHQQRADQKGKGVKKRKLLNDDKVKNSSDVRVDSQQSTPNSEPSSSIVADKELLAKKAALSGAHCLVGAGFQKQPPACFRKKVIFEMELFLYDRSLQPVQIEEACFINFIEGENEPNNQTARNGIHYKVLVVYSDGKRQQEDIYLRMMDAKTDEIIRYDGNDQIKGFRRVLVTHEATCERCLERACCGSRSQAPSDPVIIDKKLLKFFVKCCQTCALKTGGKVTSKNQRLFRLAFSTNPLMTSESILVSSGMLNCHNSPRMKRQMQEGFNPLTRTWI